MIKLLLKQLQSLLIFTILLISFSFKNMAFAQSLESLVNTNLELNLPDQGSPPDRENGGKRPGCPTISDNIYLTALIPQSNSGLTSLNRPDFYFYVPYSQNDGVSAEFVLTYIDTNTLDRINVDRQEFELGNTPGIMKINLSNSVESLSENIRYEWQLKLICHGTNDEIFVSGKMQRISLTPEIQQQLNEASLGEKIEIYAQEGLWFDLLKTVGELYYSNSENVIIKNIWQHLLEQVELNNLINKPLVCDCEN